jgi:hypothetical protein
MVDSLFRAHSALRTAVPTLAILALLSISADASSRDELLAIHQQDRQAHLTGNAALLAEHLADEVFEASNGVVERRTRDEMRAFFADYFRIAKYSKWDDVTPPEVRISQDGSMAWMLVSIEANLNIKNKAGEEKPQTLVSSWISTYEKRRGKWQMVAIASTVRTTKTQPLSQGRSRPRLRMFTL